MSAVTQLRRTTAAALAEVSGAPRPLLPAAPRIPASGPATVVELRPSPGTHGLDAPEPLAEPRAGEEVGHADRRLTDPDASRISGIARSVAQGALEVLGGSRPLQQMARWLDPENYERLQLRANLVRCVGAAQGGHHAEAPASTRRHVVVRSARVCPVSAGVYEASVVAFDQKRVRAVALRIEQRRGAWRVTALEIG
ncbi:Rv3235 family protein [Arthrobacter sp. NPDC092385]|uniref:Rv3235 family protein n=1 Tax=Arthrobacter sp. NPDC092385 TaxID=3363943 RepID=UPI0038307B42